MKWLRMPNAWGWWYFTDKLENWDLGVMQRVSRHESDGTVWYETTYANIINYNDGWWFGPFIIEKPDPTGSIS